MLNPGTDTTFCPGDSVQLNAGAGFSSYQWNNGATDSSVTAVANTRFALMATTAIGCARCDTAGLQIMPARPFDLGINKSICKGDTAIF